MTLKILTDWNDTKASAFGKSSILAQHNLHQSDMFSDDGLESILDRYPREKLAVYTMGDDPENFRSFRLGSAGDLSGKEIMEAVRRGRMWFNLRAANAELSDFDALCYEMFADLEEGTPGLKTLKQDLGVLISSPNVQVFYHLDIPLVTLWQLRGRKRIWLYPPREPFVTNNDFEAVALGETEDFYYEPGFDAGAEVFDLEPGQMLTWPQNAPHRVCNHDSVNVSLSVEFMTMPAIIRANALQTNGVMRRVFGANPDIHADGATGQVIKAGMARVLKAFNTRNAFVRHMPTTFHVDPTAESGIRDLALAAE